MPKKLALSKHLEQLFSSLVVIYFVFNTVCMCTMATHMCPACRWSVSDVHPQKCNMQLSSRTVQKVYYCTMFKFSSRLWTNDKSISTYLCKKVLKEDISVSAGTIWSQSATYFFNLSSTWANLGTKALKSHQCVYVHTLVKKETRKINKYFMSLSDCNQHFWNSIN